MLISVVIPLRDEEEVLPLLLPELRSRLVALGEEWEVVLVDDGSLDRTHELALAARRDDPRVKVLRLSRGFGHQIALSAGLEHARGDVVVTMDGDLQHPPAVIAELLAKWREGNHIVYATMAERRGESWFKGITARAFYRLLGRLAEIDVPAAAGDFRLVDRVALDAYLAMPERSRYLRGMFSWVGFQQAGVPYASPPRPAGHSKYTPRRMLRLASDAVVGFSHKPLRLALGLGFGVSLLSIAFGLSAIASRLAGAFVVPGWTSIMVLVGFVGGIQLMVLGVIGEYIARIFDEVKRRPLYVVEQWDGPDGEDG